MTWKKSMFTLNHQLGDTSPLLFDWRAWIASTITRFRSRSHREPYPRLTIAELRALDDAILRDIGIHRYQIEKAVLNGGWAEW
jgi:uncharacterized protein YjiS (DUF1127 family)